MENKCCTKCRCGVDHPGLDIYHTNGCDNECCFCHTIGTSKEGHNLLQAGNN